MTRWPRLLLVCLSIALPAQSVRAGEPSAQPFLRIETGHHAAMARRLVADSPRQRLISAGDDKTVRVWQLPQGRLIQTLRLPMGERQEGRPYAVAVTPDGKTVIVGGWTGWEWDEKASVYFFDIDSGDLLRRIDGFPDAIASLNISPDGTTLAIGLNGRGGVRFHRVADGAKLAEDAQFNDRVMEAHYAPDGRFAAVALDGYVRMYDPAGRLIGRQTLGPGAQPAGVRFSPDGERLGISFRERAHGKILSSKTFAVLGETRSEGIPAGAVFAQIAWSSDGKKLFITGDSGSAGDGRIWGWVDGGLGKMQSYPVSKGRVADMRTMPDGRLAFSTEDPAIGILEADGRRGLFVASAVADFRASGAALHASADGSVVEFPLAGKPVRFGLAERKLEAVTKARADLVAPRTTAPGIKVERWQDSEGTRINGQPVALDPYETSRSYAIAPDAQTLALGTEWTLRLLDASAKERWATPIASPAWNVTFSGDGKLVIAALGDGTLRWYRAEDGGEVMALFPHGDGQEWIVWLPSGYYLSSDYGDNFVGWQINRGKDKTPAFFRAVQFERLLYRPDLVKAAFASLGRESLAAKAGDTFDVKQLPSILPPRVKIAARTEGGLLKLRFNAEDSALPLQNFAVYVNNIPMLPLAQRQLAANEKGALQRELEMPLFEAGNVVRVEVFNGKAMGLAEQYVEAPPGVSGKRAPGDLYLLSVGVNHFLKLEGADLGAAVQDAEAVGKRFGAELGRQFRATHIKVLSDNSDTLPLKANVIVALDFIKTAKAEDTVIVFLASHGVSDEAGNYYFVPRDADPKDLESLSQISADKVKSMVSWTVFSDALRATAGRRLLIVDTCQSGNMAGTFDLHSLSKRSAASLFSLLSASKGEEQSQEYAQGGHGLFTYAMLASLSAKGTDRNGDGFISVSELFGATAPLVEQLRSKALPQTPQLRVPEPLGEAVIASLPQGLATVAQGRAKENLGCGTRTLVVGKRDDGCPPVAPPTKENCRTRNLAVGVSQSLCKD